LDQNPSSVLWQRGDDMAAAAVLRQGLMCGSVAVSEPLWSGVQRIRFQWGSLRVRALREEEVIVEVRLYQGQGFIGAFFFFFSSFIMLLQF
jgi:hypothetical protein